MLVNILCVIILFVVIAFWARFLFFFLWMKVFGKSRKMGGYDPGAENYTKEGDDSNKQG